MTTGYKKEVMRGRRDERTRGCDDNRILKRGDERTKT